MKSEKRAIGRMILTTGFCALLGFFGGMFAARIADWAKGFFQGAVAAFYVVAPYSNLFLTTVVLVAGICLMRKARSLYRSWDGEDEDVIDRAERKVAYAMVLTSVNMIAGMFLFGLGIYSLMEYGDVQEGAGRELVLIIAGLIYMMIANFALDKRAIGFEKEINPEKQGSVYDSRFHEVWMRSCDESEKLQIYQAGYASMRAGTAACALLWIFSTVGMMTWDFGIMPMAMVLVIWLVMLVRYHAACLRVKK